MAKPVTVAAISQLLKLTERRVQQLVQDGVLPRPVRRAYDPVVCVHAYIDYLRKLASGAGEMSLTDERTRLTKLQADLAEIELRKANGEMISAKTAMRLWGEVVSAVKQRLLGLPTRLAPIVATRNIAQAKERLELAMHEILNELSGPDLTVVGKIEYGAEEHDLFSRPNEGLDETEQPNDEPEGGDDDE